jgi:hypothetical protein
MKIKKKYKILTVLTLILLFFFWGGVEINEKLEWKMTEDLIAKSGFTTEVGCIGAQETPCVPCTPPACEPPLCLGGEMCLTLDVVRCALYSEIIGVQTGPQPCHNLFLKASTKAAGLIPSASYIAAGMGPTMMDQGPLASWGGCVNCYAQNESKWKQKFAVAKDMFMAIFKD